METLNPIKAARKGSGLTLEQAAKILGVDRNTYINREKNPSNFSIDDLAKLYKELDHYGRLIIDDYRSQIFLSK